MMKKNNSTLSTDKKATSEQLIIAKRIKECREALRENAMINKNKGMYTQRYMAKMLNVSHSVISKHETGTLRPSLEHLRMYCKVYNCTMDYLTGLSDEREPYSEKRNKENDNK